MKVLQVINTLAAGGAETHLLTLVTHLRELGVGVEVASLRSGTFGARSLLQDFVAEGTSVSVLGGESSFDIRPAFRLGALAREVKPDIVHTHLPRADMVGYFARKYWASFRFVCSIHAIYGETWSGRRLIPLLDHVWGATDKLVAISDAVRNWLVDRRGFPSAHISVIPYGIDVSRFERSPRNLREAWGLKDRKTIGSIGRLEPSKGQETLIRAMGIVSKQVPEAILLLAGHDPWGYARELQDIIVGHGLEDHVRLVGFQEDVVSFLHALDIFAFASISEGFGQVIVEAMAAGRPIVASRIPPLTDIILEDITGLLAHPEDPFDFAEAIDSLLSDPMAGAEMGRRGTARATASFGARRMAERTLALYEALA